MLKLVILVMNHDKNQKLHQMVQLHEIIFQYFLNLINPQFLNLNYHIEDFLHILLHVILHQVVLLVIFQI